MVQNTMEITFIDSNMASPSLAPTNDAEGLSEYLNGFQSNNEDHEMMMANHVMSSEGNGSSGEGAVGSSDDVTDLAVSLELSSSHPEGTQSFSHYRLIPLKR